jgi:hypothetical protein
MPDGYNVDELRAAAVASQEKVDQMVGGGGPASDAEAFVFDAEMIHIFAEQLVYVTELLGKLDADEAPRSWVTTTWEERRDMVTFLT